MDETVTIHMRCGYALSLLQAVETFDPQKFSRNMDEYNALSRFRAGAMSWLQEQTEGRNAGEELALTKPADRFRWLLNVCEKTGRAKAAAHTMVIALSEHEFTTDHDK